MCDIATGQCTIHDFSCDSGNPCTSGRCITSNGKATCKYTTMDCNGDMCTKSSCNPTTAKCEVTSTMNCDDGNMCTADKCDPKRGCLHIPINCDDNNACTEGNW